MRKLMVLAALVAFAGCKAPQHYVLVHGGFMGAWVWDETAKQLRAQGEEVTVLDLPGHGQDQTPASQITLASYVDAVAAAVDAAGTPVVLVGHSMAGGIIGPVAERMPKKIKLLVYFAALVIPDGKSQLDVGPQDPDSLIPTSVQIDSSTGLAHVPPDKLQPLFCADCSAAQLQNLQDHYRDDYVGPLTEKVTATDANWGSVPKAYVFTANDRAISYGFQQTMAATMTLQASEVLNTSHCAQLAAPQQLAEALEKVSRR